MAVIHGAHLPSSTQPQLQDDSILVEYFVKS